MSWPYREIKDVARVVGGATPKSGEAAFWDGDVAWVTPKDLADLDGKDISDTPRKITDLGLRSCSAELLPAGSVLFSSRAPIGHIAINSVPVATNQGFKSFIPGPDLNASFLYWWLDANRDRLQAMGNGATFKEVSKGVVERIVIPVPPLREQQRIGAILDQANAIRRLRRQTINYLRALKQSIFDDVFGRAPNAADSPVIRLADLSELINGDRSSNYPSGSDIKRAGIPFLSTANIRDGQLDLSTCNFITKEKFLTLSRGKLSRNDIIITLRGTLGQCALFDCEFDTGFINAQMMIIRCSHRIMPRYLKEYLSLPSVQSRLKKSNSGTAVPQLTAAQMKELEIIVPEMDAQKEFVRRFDHLDQVSRYNLAHLDGLDSLFASLQHRAFRGDL